MSTLRLIKLAFRYHWDAQKSNPANLIAATLGMVLNNVIILWGLWVMLFDGKPNSSQLTLYFLSLNTIVVLAWGMICFFFGGVRSLSEYIEDGTLEPMLATPRNPLVLVGISQSITPALGDILQGLCNLAALFYLAPFALASRCALFALVSGIAFLGLFILTGSVPFFIRRGSALAQLLLECNLSLSFYPTGQVFSGRTRVLLFLTPAAVTGVLPIEAIESGSLLSGVVAWVAASLFLWVAVQVFRIGLKRYQSASYVTIRN